MDLMVNPVITDFQQDVNGDIKMLKIGQKKQDAYANIIGQAETVDLENNKTATINVSTYTQPVEITPTSGKDGMKKATVTLSNIPSPSESGAMYYWGAEGVDRTLILPFNVFPSEVTSSMVIAQLSRTQEIISTTTWSAFVSENEVEKLSDTSFRYIVSEEETYTFSLDTTSDVTIESLFGSGTTWTTGGTGGGN